MIQPLKLMCILAHPDDESLGTGGILARYAAEGIETYLVTATRGERGWFGPEEKYPGPEKLGQIRETELRAAARELGLQEVTLLGYRDGELDQADPAEAIGKIAAEIRRVRPEVVVTFDPYGSYGHPDHIAICQFTTAAVMDAATCRTNGSAAQTPHQVAKLYYMVETQQDLAAYQAAFGELAMEIDGQRRQAARPGLARIYRVPADRAWWPASAYWQQVWRAISCHQTQLPGYEILKNLPDEHHQNLWASQSYYRAFSLVNGGRQVENDLFAGLR